jgi:gliding motility-associated-like protein
MRSFFSLSWLLLFFMLPFCSGAQSYVFAQLSGSPINTTGWNLQGNAYVGNVTGSSEIILTNASNTQSGAIFFNQAINLAQCTQWAVEFDFRMYGGTMADGIAFCFLDVPPVGFVNGGGLGIPGTANGLKVCFDTYNNCNGQGIVPKVEIRWGIGYDECWSQPTVNNMSFIRSPNYNHAKILYNAGVISVYINDILYLTGNQAFNFSGYFGFTASTGGSTDVHSIKNVVVYTNMPASEAGNNKTICSGQSVSIGAIPNLLYTYQWYPSAGLNSATIADPVVTLVNTTNTPITQTYFVSTAYSSGTGCPGIDSVKVTVLPSPSITINASATTVCTGTTVNFYAVASNGSATPGFQWMINGSPAGTNSQNFSFNNFNNGDVVSCILTSSSCGNDTSNAIAININGNTTPVSNIIATATSVCKGTPVTFTASGNPSAISNYQWTKNGLVTGSNSASYTDNNLLDGDVVQCLMSFTGVCLSSPTALSNAITMQVQTATQVDLGPDKGFCPGNNVILNAGSFDHYSWSSGATSASVTVNVAGQYSVIAFSPLGCASYDTVIVNAFNNPVVNLGPSMPLCFGTTKTLDAGQFENYLWNDGSTGRTLVVNAQGNYSVTVTDFNGCKGMASTSITSILPLPADFLPEDTAICSYGSLELKAANGMTDFLWSTNETSSSITIMLPGIYWLKASDGNNCRGEDSVVVLPKECLKGFFAPSAFTPNNDGKNDVFRPLIFGNIKKYRFIIFNRWGNIVFESYQVMKGWDGNIRGAKQSSGVFIWSCNYQLDNEMERTEKGTLMLIR